MTCAAATRTTHFTHTALRGRNVLPAHLSLPQPVEQWNDKHSTAGHAMLQRADALLLTPPGAVGKCAPAHTHPSAACAQSKPSTHHRWSSSSNTRKERQITIPTRCARNACCHADTSTHTHTSYPQIALQCQFTRTYHTRTQVDPLVRMHT